MPMLPSAEPMLSTEASAAPASVGRSSRVSAIGAVRFVLMTSSVCSSSSDSIGPKLAIPAQLTSTFAWRACAASRTACRACASLRSTASTSTRPRASAALAFRSCWPLLPEPPWGCTSARARASAPRCSPERPTSSTRAPAAVSLRHSSLPMPPAAPVTTADIVLELHVAAAVTAGTSAVAPAGSAGSPGGADCGSGRPRNTLP